MQLFTTIDNAFRFDATSDFLKKFSSFGLLLCADGIGFDKKRWQISKAEEYLKPCKTSKMKPFIKIDVNYFRKNLHLRCLTVF